MQPFIDFPNKTTLALSYQIACFMYHRKYELSYIMSTIEKSIVNINTNV